MITVSPVSNNQTWAVLINRLNTLTELMTQNVVTADATTTGSITVGNTQLVGTFSANTIAVDKALRGGNVATSNTLNIVSNTVISLDNVPALSLKKIAGSVQYVFTSNTMDIDVTTLNISSSNTIISGANTNVNSFLTVNGESALNGNSTIVGNVSITGIVETFGSFVQDGGFTHTGGQFDITGNTTIVGKLSVNSNTDVGNLTVNGNQTVNGNGAITGNLTVTDTIFGTVVSPSDMRVKTGVEPLEGALEMVTRMNGITYRWYFGEVESSERHYGLIAQDVEKAAPLAVTIAEAYNYPDFKHVNYIELVPILIEAIKELKERVEELENGAKA